MSWFKAWRIARLQERMSALIARKGMLADLLKHEHFSYERDRYLETCEELAMVKSRIERLMA